MSEQVIKDALWVDVGDLTVLRNGRIFRNNWGGVGKVKEVKQSKNPRFGYLQFTYNGKSVRAHRIVAMAYITNPDDLPIINHKSEKFSKPADNSPLNLEWCDYTYNNTYGNRIKKFVKSKSKKVYQYTLDGEFIREWPPATEVYRQLGWYSGNISWCCLGKPKSSHGYRWSYTPLH